MYIFYVYNMKTIFNSTKIQTTLPLININQQRRPSLAAFCGELLIHTSNNRVYKNSASRKKSSPLPAINHFFCTCTPPKLNSPPSETKTTCINTTHAHRTRAKETSRRFAESTRERWIYSRVSPSLFSLFYFHPTSARHYLSLPVPEAQGVGKRRA